MTYVAVVISCLMVVGIVALVIQTIQSAGPEPWLKISAAIVSSLFASLLLIPLGYAVARPWFWNERAAAARLNRDRSRFSTPGVTHPGPAGRVSPPSRSTSRR